MKAAFPGMAELSLFFWDLCGPIHAQVTYNIKYLLTVSVAICLIPSLSQAGSDEN